MCRFFYTNRRNPPKKIEIFIYLSFPLNHPYSLNGSLKKKLMLTQLIHGLMSLSPEKRFHLEPTYLYFNPEESTYLLQDCFSF